MTTTLLGKNAVITGAGRGLGKCIAEHFVKAGASVFLGARTLSELETTQQELKNAIVSDNQKIEIAQLDLKSQPSITEFTTSALRSFESKVDILVNNAGIYGPFGQLDELDWEAWVDAITINLIGTVSVTREFLPQFKNHKSGSIIVISGGGATQPLPNISAYAASKAGLLRWTETLAEELKDYNIPVNAIAPGALATKLNQDLVNTEPKQVGPLYDKIKAIVEKGGTPPDKAANLAVFLAGEATTKLTGKLISAVWDSWQSFNEQIDKLGDSDIYTLRRIIPEDRHVTLAEKV